MSDPLKALGVVGAGTMGAGIAQAACLGGVETDLFDPFPEALERGLENLRTGLDKGANSGRWTASEAEAALTRLNRCERLEDLRHCELIIEAAPEKSELKAELFAALSEICDEHTVLATNTSSLSVTALATAFKNPKHVVGMHFFNPVPLMPLVEIVAGMESTPDAVALARRAAEQMGKHAIEAMDGPGFLVNRCGRPFGGEALRLYHDGFADIATIDRICRMAGFRMGPFELMDLVGIDVGLEVARSFYRQSFHEPRWRPSPVQVRMVDARQLGRKSGSGFYRYGEGPHRPKDPPAPERGGGRGSVSIEGASRLAEELRVLAAEAGYTVQRGDSAATGAPAAPDLRVDARIPPEASPPGQAAAETSPPAVLLCAAGSLAQLGGTGDFAGFHALPPLADSSCVELTRGSRTSAETAQAAESFFSNLGFHVEWVGDAPGLVLGRIVCQLVNEACFALTEGVAAAADIDKGVRLGLNYPRGPLEWGDAIGLDHVLAVLDGLSDELREDRYRAAPLLRRMVAEGKLGRKSGRGFFDYPEGNP